MRVIGVLGGMGPLASAAFLERVVAETAAERDQDHVPIVLVSWPEVPDRTSFILGAGPDPRPALIEGAGRLKAAGAEFLVIPCNTANVWIDEVAEAVGLTPVHWLDAAISQARSRGYRRALVLATSGSIRAGTYQERLASSGIEYVLPDPDLQSLVMGSIYDLKAGKLTEADRRRLAGAIDDHAVMGVDCAVLACTELPLVLRGQHVGVPLIDPADEVARTVIRLSGARTKG